MVPGTSGEQGRDRRWKSAVVSSFAIHTTWWSLSSFVHQPASLAGSWNGLVTRQLLGLGYQPFMDSKAAEYFKKEKVPKYLPLFTVEESYQLLSWIAGAKMSIQMLEKGILCPFQSFLFY